ncbi:MAG: methyltransferase [Clostridia bacterium]|nr:methyltransferase [Clostridia bacterium]
MQEFKEFDCLDDLQLGGWKVWQNSRFFRFGTDGVLLAEFARCTPKERVIDLCSGTGIVPFLLLAKGQAETAEALELQPYLCRLMERSVEENNCADRMTVMEGDVKDIRSLVKGRAYDLVTVNPPYEPMGRGILGQNPHRELARREVACTLEDIISAAAYLLKSGGRLVMVHRPFRLPELFGLMEQYGFAVSRMQMVEFKEGERPSLVLMEGILHSKRELVVEPTLRRIQ